MKKIFIFILMCTFFVIAGCTLNATSDEFDAFIKEVNIPAEINASIELPTISKNNKVAATWESNNPKVLASDGALFMPDEDVTVMLTVKMESATKTKEQNIEVKVVPSKKDPFTTAYRMCASNIYDNYKSNATFKSINYRDFESQVVSLTPSVITDDGVITQAEYDQDALLKIIITDKSTKESRVYYKNIVVKEYTEYGYVNLISEWLEEKVKAYENGEIKTLPTEHEKYPSKIEWTSSKQSFITSKGTIIRPIEYVDDVITCTIKYGDVNVSKKYEVKNIGGNSVESFLDEYLEYIMPTKVKSHHSYVWQQYNTEEYFLKTQVEINTGGVLNLIDGKPLSINTDYYIDVVNQTAKYNKLYYTLFHRGVGSYVKQSDLDAYFGEGYKIPNDSNIFWIVVHESGMPLPTQNAELLAKQQMNQATTTNEPRQASWHYQVDAYSIYQSYPESVECWHAGGDYNAPDCPHYKYGNTNSVGIEMCINVDGNYDGAMHNDTKLVANLVNKYNLGIQNVQRHFDFAGKECPSYMIRMNRWNEFLDYVKEELIAIKYLRDAKVTWTVSNLDTLFDKGPNGLYYAKAVDHDTNVDITLDVQRGDYHFNKTVSVTLQKDDIDLSIWKWVDLNAK